MAAMRVLSLWGSPLSALFIPLDHRFIANMSHSSHQPPLIDNISHQPSSQLVTYQQKYIGGKPSKFSSEVPSSPLDTFFSVYAHHSHHLHTLQSSSGYIAMGVRAKTATPMGRHWVALLGLLVGLVLLIGGLVLLLQQPQSENGHEGGLEFGIVLLGLGVVCIISVSIFYACSKKHLLSYVHGAAVV
jgi:hypothetical protein